MIEDPTFDPQNGSPTIHVDIQTAHTVDREKEIQRMWNEHTAETEHAKEQAQGTEKLRTVYNTVPIIIYEYDVVACEDFVEDKGCWIRNMPQEIRDSNPDFVPLCAKLSSK
jgi:hypothetical protein